MSLYDADAELELARRVVDQGRARIDRQMNWVLELRSLGYSELAAEAGDVLAAFVTAQNANLDRLKRLMRAR